MQVAPNVLKQFIDGKVVYLPVLFVDGKLTEISGVKHVDTVKEALEIAETHVTKLKGA